MNKQDEDKALTFFQIEEQDWQLVRQAALMGDEHAAWSFRIMMLTESCLESLWHQHALERNHEISDAADDPNENCRLILASIDEVVMLRLKVLYEDYRIQEKRSDIRKKINRYFLTQIQFTHVQNN